MFFNMVPASSMGSLLLASLLWALPSLRRFPCCALGRNLLQAHTRYKAMSETLWTHQQRQQQQQQQHVTRPPPMPELPDLMSMDSMERPSPGPESGIVYDSSSDANTTNTSSTHNDNSQFIVQGHPVNRPYSQQQPSTAAQQQSTQQNSFPSLL